MRVSWLLPVRDGGDWLIDAVASVLEDTTTSDELLIIDDHSMDGALAHVPDDRRIRIIPVEGEGLVAALETGRRGARGTYLARMDSDDITLPGRLNAQVAYLESHPNVVAVGGRIEPMEEPFEPGPGMGVYYRWLNTLADLRRECLIECPLSHPTVCIRAQEIADIGGYRNGAFPEDYDLWLRVLAKGMDLARLDKPVLRKRDTPECLTRTSERYSERAFNRVKQDFLEAVVMPKASGVVLWAGREGGRPWLRWLDERGTPARAVVDLHQEGMRRRNVPVIHPDRYAPWRDEILLVAVGTYGARAEIREHLETRHPSLVEGSHWWALR